MKGSSNYFVKPEQVAVLLCLPCHSFPAAARLYLICLSFSTSPDSFCNPLFCNAWIAAVCSHPSLPSLRRQNVERVGNRLFFLPFHSSQVLSCIQSGKVAFSLSSDRKRWSAGHLAACAGFGLFVSQLGESHCFQDDHRS